MLIIMWAFEVKFIFYVGQHGLSQRSVIKDKISGERYQDNWSSVFFFLSFLFVCLFAYKGYKPLSHKAITYVAF